MLKTSESTDTPGTEPKESSVEAALDKARAERILTDEDLGAAKVLGGHPREEDDGEVHGMEPGPEDGDEDNLGLEEDGEAEEDEEKPPKHRTVEAANKAAKEAERKMHAKAQEAARLRKELEELKRRSAEVQTKVLERAEEISEAESKAFRVRIMRQMRQLDPADEDYEEKISDLWDQYHDHRDKRKAVALKQAAKEIVQEELDARNREETERQTRLALWDKANRLAEKAGLDMQDAGVDERTGKPIRSDDYLLFWRTAPDAPEELDEDGKIQWTVKEVQRILGRKVSAKSEAESKVKELQARRTPLGRGGTGPAQETGDSRPITLGAALEKARERRRI